MIEDMFSQIQNKVLVFNYPFLIPRNYHTDEIDEDYDYKYTFYDNIPQGWRKAFGMKMLKELKEILNKAHYLDDYRVVQVKEKFGTLRWYDNGAPEDIYTELINWNSKYEALSALTCIDCGEPAIGMTTGWINPVCEKHAEGHKIERYKI